MVTKFEASDVNLFQVLSPQLITRYVKAQVFDVAVVQQASMRTPPSSRQNISYQYAKCLCPHESSVEHTSIAFMRTPWNSQHSLLARRRKSSQGGVVVLPADCSDCSVAANQAVAMASQIFSTKGFGS